MDAVKQQYASVLNNLGAQRVQGDVRAEELTQRAKGQYQTQLSQFGAQLAGTGQFLTRLRANKQMNEMYSNILSAKYFDFGISKDLYNKVVRGEELSEQEIFQLKTSPYATQLEELAQWARSSKKTTTQ